MFKQVMVAIPSKTEQSKRKDLKEYKSPLLQVLRSQLPVAEKIRDIKKHTSKEVKPQIIYYLELEQATEDKQQLVEIVRAIFSTCVPKRLSEPTIESMEDLIDQWAFDPEKAEVVIFLMGLILESDVKGKIHQEIILKILKNMIDAGFLLSPYLEKLKPDAIAKLKKLKDPETGAAAFHYASVASNLDVLAWFYRHEADLTAKTTNHDLDTLGYAIYMGRKDSVEFLVTTAKMKLSPLERAVFDGAAINAFLTPASAKQLWLKNSALALAVTLWKVEPVKIFLLWAFKTNTFDPPFLIRLFTNALEHEQFEIVHEIINAFYNNPREKFLPTTVSTLRGYDTLKKSIDSFLRSEFGKKHQALFGMQENKEKVVTSTSVTPQPASAAVLPNPEPAAENNKKAVQSSASKTSASLTQFSTVFSSARVNLPDSFELKEKSADEIIEIAIQYVDSKQYFTAIFLQIAVSYRFALENDFNEAQHYCSIIAELCRAFMSQLPSIHLWKLAMCADLFSHTATLFAVCAIKKSRELNIADDLNAKIKQLNLFIKDETSSSLVKLFAYYNLVILELANGNKNEAKDYFEKTSSCLREVLQEHPELKADIELTIEFQKQISLDADIPVAQLKSR